MDWNCRKLWTYIADPTNVSNQLLLAEPVRVHPRSSPFLHPTPFLDSSSLDSVLLLATHLCHISTPSSNVYLSHWVFKPLTMAIKLNLNWPRPTSYSLNHLLLYSNHAYSAHQALSTSGPCLLFPTLGRYFPWLLLILEITAWTSFSERPFLAPSPYYPLAYPYGLLGSVSTFISCINLFIC